MFRLTEANALAYLASSGRAPAEPCRVTPLGGGVSNVVLRVTGPGTDLVLKQPFARLRVEADWPATLERARIEARCLEFLAQELGVGTVPALCFFDADRHVVCMEAVPAGHRMWKAELLDGRVRLQVARRVGGLLGRIHGRTWQGARMGTVFDDPKAFHQLRVDPYYREVQRRHPVAAEAVDAAVAAMEAHRLALVHGDYSPKNLLVGEQGDGAPVLIDCEVAHKGDPAFDAAFVLNHLLLKLVHVPGARDALAEAALVLWRAYRTQVREVVGDVPEDLEPRTVLHLSLLQLARIDGKSPAEYIRREAEKETVRNIGMHLLQQGVTRIDEAVAFARERASAADAAAEPGQPAGDGGGER